MDGPGTGPVRGLLDVTAGREVVFCHQCAHEWYRDDHNGLDCPRCQTEVTEIVSFAIMLVTMVFLIFTR